MVVLDEIPLNEVDQMMVDMWAQKYVRLCGMKVKEDKPISWQVNNGDSYDDLMTVTVQGRLEYVAHHVFVDKIRRESRGMNEAQQERRVAWCTMAQAFIHKFGEGKTPPDIIACLRDVRSTYGVE